MAFDQLTESDLSALILEALSVYEDRCLRLLVIGESGSGKTTFCNALYEKFYVNGPGDSHHPIALALKAQWDDGHKVGPETKVPGGRFVRLNNLGRESRDQRYLLLMDIPGPWFRSESHKDFVSQIARSADIWVLVCDFRGRNNGLVKAVDDLLDARGLGPMPCVWVLATHCDGRSRDKDGVFKPETFEFNWGAEWAEAVSKGFDGLVIPPRLGALGAQYEVPLHDLIMSSTGDDLFGRFAELLSVQLERVRQNQGEAATANQPRAQKQVWVDPLPLIDQLKKILPGFGRHERSIDLWNRLGVSNSGVGIVLTGYDTRENYEPLNGFANQIELLADKLLSRLGREVPQPSWQEWGSAELF